MYFYDLAEEWLEVLKPYLIDELKYNQEEIKIYNQAFMIGVYGGDELANFHKQENHSKIWKIGFLTGQDCIKKHLKNNKT